LSQFQYVFEENYRDKSTRSTHVAQKVALTSKSSVKKTEWSFLKRQNSFII